MEYKLAERLNGQFDIIRSEPIIIATCNERAIAQQLLLFFEGGSRAPESKVTTASVSAEPHAVFKRREPVADSVPAPALPIAPPQKTPAVIAAPVVAVPVQTTPAPKTEPVALEIADTVELEWDEEELDLAFERLARGEKLQDVANSFGKNWRKLRGKWAHQKKKHSEMRASADRNLPALAGQQRALVDIVSSTVSEMKDQRPCNMCGRYFSITPERIDNCGRPDCAS